ncbi:MAG: hypothetical protein DI565_15285 [Ancylobacter novellus]|uniref:Hemolysin-type calcium-binding region n=1 Tax=Ancylobacter novellus TaxID=921 RepID=A0A2W5KAK4_ANCNO|nr:MAG: hypothetical protein DI565_15285 [Ancylobacter novellus]
MVKLIRGTNGADTIDGTWDADEIRAGRGDDTIYGHGGGDLIFGGAGDDLILVAEDDTVHGGAGDDSIVGVRLLGDYEIQAGAGDDTIFLAETSSLWTENALIHGGKGFDTIVFAGQNEIYETDVVSVERFAFDRDGVEIRAREDQIFDARWNMKVEVFGADADTGAQHLTIIGFDGRLDASKLQVSNWDADDLVELWGWGGDDRIIGSDHVDFLYGWDGNDTLNGGGGADFLRGGAGADLFVIDVAAGPDAVDTIQDFVVGEDVVRLNAHGLGANRLGEKAFHVGTEAADKSDRVIYDRDTGALYFDRDGSGTAFEAVKIAQLSAGLDLSYQDFLLA